MTNDTTKNDSLKFLNTHFETEVSKVYRLKSSLARGMTRDEQDALLKAIDDCYQVLEMKLKRKRRDGSEWYA